MFFSYHRKVYKILLRVLFKMTEKQKLLDNLIEKSGKSAADLSKMISEKVNEMSGLISEEGAIYIIANELGVRLESERPKKETNLVKIDEITEPKVPVSLLCKVLRKYDRVTFSSKNGDEGSVQSLLVGDESGIIRVVFWYDKTDLLENIHEGDVLKVINAYTRENNQNPGRIEVHYSQYSDIEVNPAGVSVEVKEYKAPEIENVAKKVSDLDANDRNVKISGIVTDFEIPRFYFGCPECFKKVFQDDGNYNCAEHEKVDAIKIPIVNLIVDDSSGTIGVVGFRDRAVRVTGLSDNEIIALTEDIDKYRAFSKKIIGAKINFVGNVSTNNMTGDMQVLLNQVLGIEFKSVIEIADDLIAKEGGKKKAVKSKSAPQEVDLDDDFEEIEEIDIDDDLL